MKIELNKKLFLLKQIYKIYGDFIGSLDVACQKYCSRCCTNNVIMTTLEGHLIAEHIHIGKSFDLLKKVKKGVSKKRFLPQTTTNKMAELCVKGKDLPQEDHPHTQGICPILTDDLCPIYTVRPFGCRCLVSKHDCRKTGYADIEPLVLTVNHLMLQFIEHIDASGFSGNLADILMLLATKKNRRAHEANALKISNAPLISNLPIKVLMIPPEHRMHIQPILNALNNINVSANNTKAL